MYIHVHSSIIHNKIAETAHTYYVHQWMDMYICIYDGILFNCKKEWTLNTCYKNIQEPQKHYTE